MASGPVLYRTRALSLRVRCCGLFFCFLLSLFSLLGRRTSLSHTQHTLQPCWATFGKPLFSADDGRCLPVLIAGGWRGFLSKWWRYHRVARARAHININDSRHSLLPLVALAQVGIYARIHSLSRFAYGVRDVKKKMRINKRACSSFPPSSSLPRSLLFCVSRTEMRFLQKTL